VYNPEINETPRALIVEGLITNEDRAHSIRLSKGTPFDSLGSIPEKGANVFISDENGRLFSFKENGPGIYVSAASDFKSIIGSKYILNIRTSDGKVYQSSEQELLEVKNLSIINSIKKVEKFSIVDKGEIIINPVPGSQFLTSLELTGDKFPYYRFSNTFIAEYTSKRDSPSISYCWQKYNPNIYFNINNTKTNTSGLFLHDLGFCPIDTTFYGITVIFRMTKANQIIRITNELDKYVVSFKQYRMNKDVYEYYKALNKQLEAKQQIFDPIPFQSVGNIKCTSHPNDLVLGIFEVSSVDNLTFRVNPVESVNSYSLIPIGPIDMDTIPKSGRSPFVKPKTWIH
jgi:hypothetical protein